MQTRHGGSWIKTELRIFLVALVLAACVAPDVYAQHASPPQKPSPPKIESRVFLLPESIVQTQWPHTLELVNAPQDISLINPGQCVRIGVYATGDQRDAFLRNTRLSYRVNFAGHVDVHPLADLSAFKKIKPEGGDFVAAALGAAGVEQPEATKTFASLGISGDHWCAPIDPDDGAAAVEVAVAYPGGHDALPPSTIQVESFDTGSKRSFKDVEEFGAFLQTYYRQPNPARLLPALQFIFADQEHFSKAGQAEIVAAFLTGALSSDATAAKDFQARIITQPPRTRALGLLILRAAGFDIESSLNTLSNEDHQKFLELSPLQDPFDLTPSQQLFQHLDMIWSVFGATGQFKPVATIVSALEWRADYIEFDKLRKSVNHPTELTPSIVRAVVYTAAGWSLRSFQRTDPLVADYIDYLRASPDTTPSVKSELAALQSNPAFERAGGK